jgi:hypothetical protein
MLGGINNAALFGATKEKPRFARKKLGQMGGIMSSSPELMNAVNASSAPPAMTPKPPPLVPAGNMPVQPTLPTAVPPMLPKPQPQPPQPQQVAAAAPQPQQTMPMKEGGPIDVGEAPKVSEKNVLLTSLMAIPGLSAVVPRLIKKHGSEEKAEEEVAKKKAAVDTAVASGNEENIANTVVDQAGLPVSEKGKREFARNAFGMENVNDIDEINRRIANVAISGSIGKGNDAYVQAVLLGLGEMKKTASARAEAAADAAGGGFLDTEQGKAALEIYTKRIENNEDPAEVEALMNSQLGNNIGTKVRIAIAGSSPAPQQQTTGGLEVGRTATGPNGEKIRWVGTKWQKM